MKKKQHKTTATIADVLHYSADHVLAATKYEYHAAIGKHKYSCCAVSKACGQLKVNINIVMKGLTEMGCPIWSLNAFNDEGYHNFSEKNQQARYFWLKWAALMAEEQGV